MMYLTIDPEGHVGLRKVEDNDEIKRKFISETVGGWFDVTSMVVAGQQCWMYVNDEGLLNNMPRNELATFLMYGTQNAMAFIDPSLPDYVIQTYEGPLYIAGTAVLAQLDDNGEDITVDDTILFTVMNIALSMAT